MKAHEDQARGEPTKLRVAKKTQGKHLKVKKIYFKLLIEIFRVSKRFDGS